jgi:hypothetical protein
MTARFRAETRMMPQLETQYNPRPKVASSVEEYRPGLRHTLPHRLHTSEPYTYTISVGHLSIFYQSTAIPGSFSTQAWDILKTKVFHLYGNEPVIYGTLLGLKDEHGYTYPYGSLLPARSSTFTPVVTFT